VTRRRKIILFNLALLVLLLVLAELGVRLFTQRNMPFAERERANLQYEPNGLYRFAPKPSQTVLHGNHGQITDTVAYHINQWGFRGPEMPLRKAPGETRVAVVGGSHVFDVNALDGRGNPGWPSLLSDSSSYLLTVINAGVPGSDSRDYAARILHQLRPLQPDRIVILSTWNDLKWIYAYPAGQPLKSAPKALVKDPLAERVNVWDDLLGWSVIYRKLRDAYWKRNRHLQPGWAENVELAKGPVDVEEGLRQYGLNLSLAVSAAKNIGAVPVLGFESRLAVPGLPQEHRSKIRLDLVPGIDSFEELVKAYERCDSVIAAVAKTKDVEVAVEGVDGDSCPECFADHTHYTDAGSRRNAKRIGEELGFLQPLPPVVVGR
jgi:hypothetical protein